MAFRTQKISQMTPKGANLEATDLIEVSTIESGSYVTRSITGQEIIDAAVGNVDWGDIGGTLSAQTDLQSALDAKVPTSRTLTINGVTQDLSADRTFTISTGITIGSTAITSGTVGRILFEGAGNVVQESSSLFWDNTNGTLETTTTADNLFGLRLKSTTGQLRVKPYLNPTYGVLMESKNIADSAYLPFTISGSRILLADGNVLINTTTDAGFRLDVNGTARVQAAGEVLRIQGTTATGNSYIQYRNTSGNLGYIGWGSSLNNHFNLFTQQNADAIFGTNNIERLRILAGGNVGIGTNTSSSGYSGNARVLSIVDNATSNVGSFRAYGGGTTTSVELYGSSADVGLFGSTNHPMAFWTNNTERLRINGSTGNVLINTTTDAGYRLDVNGTARFKDTGSNSSVLIDYATGGYIRVNDPSLNEAIRLRAGGGASWFNTGQNLLIGTTTDAGFRLDVNGIGRFGVNASSSSVTIGQTAVNTGYIINATGYASSQYAYRFNNINGGTALFGGNNQQVIHRLDGGYQGSTTLQINGSSTISGASYLTSSILELNSTIQGFLPPRMTTTQKNAIATPAAGLVVYDTTLNKLCVYTTAWETVTSL